MPRARSPWLRRAALLAAGLLLAELALRLVGVGFRVASGRGGGLERSPSAPAYLCIGDSCVWGPNFDPARSYPAQLEALLVQRGESGRAVQPIVLNYGSPGRPSWEVPRDLEPLLDARRFEAVLVTVGANNVWRDPDAEQRGAWADRIRLWKLVRLVAARLRGPHDVDPGRPAEAIARAESELDEARLFPRLRADLARSAELARAHGAPLFVVCYASDGGAYGLANRCLRRAAAELALSLVDPEPAARELASRVGHERVYFLDLHPRPVGYQVVARVAWEALRAAGLLGGAPGEPLSDPLAGLEQELATRPLIELATDDAPAIVLRDGPPHARCVLFGWEDPSWTGAEHPLPPQQELASLLGAELDAGSLPQRAVRFEFDANGDARVPLAALLPDEAKLRGYSFFATYVALRPTPSGEELIPNSIAPPTRLVRP
jgi:lysophospholipase L1-like esterase